MDWKPRAFLEMSRTLSDSFLTSISLMLATPCNEGVQRGLSVASAEEDQGEARGQALRVRDNVCEFLVRELEETH